MSTNSNIAILNEDNTVTAIYCHWDGMPKHNGKMLTKHYNTIDKINQLLSLGALSSLDEKLFPDENSKHTFDKPQKGVTITYHRDRNDRLVINKYDNIEDYILNNQYGGVEYFYIWMENAWYYSEGKLEFKKLS